MQELWKLIGTPRHLFIFEAAARHLSFTKAAEELNVQQPAVSAAIKRLEDSLQATLFLRSHKKVELTSAGARFYSDVSRALHQILDASRIAQGYTQVEHVTLNASTAFNTYWMIPRLRAFRESHPNIDLRLQSSDREPDLDVEGITLAVRRGTGTWRGCHARFLAPEVIYPIASPALMEEKDLPRKEAILDETLIHLEEPIRERQDWSDWFAAFAMQVEIPASGLRLNDYALVINAAIAGEGFACGWHHLSERLISSNLLAARQDWSWETGLGFYLVWSKSRPLGKQGRRVRDWMLSAAEL